MRKIFVAAAAATLVVAAASTASAGKKTQVLKCSTSKAGAFKDNLPGRKHAVPLCVFSNAASIQLTIDSTQIGGLGATKHLKLIVLGSVDPRTETLPKTYRNAGSGSIVTGSFSNLTAFPKSKITSWAIAEGSNTVKFSITLTGFNKLTSQLSGKFSGQMKPGLSNPKAGKISITGGTFVGDATFLGF